MFGFKKRRKQQTKNIEIGSEVYFCDSIYCEPIILSGTITEIYLSLREICYAVEPDNKSWIKRANSEVFFKTKNECINYWINYLEKERDKE